MKRFSKTFSVMMDMPSASAASSMNCACRSVGNPGCGSVWMSAGLSGPFRLTVIQSSPVSTSQPMACSLTMAMRRNSGSMPRTVTGPPVTAPPARNVPLSTRSPTVVWRQGCMLDSGTPSTVMWLEPWPDMRAPMALSISHKSDISGSRAAFSMTVTPSATTAAMSMFSVAPTLGNSSVTLAPCRPSGVDAISVPWSTSNFTPSDSSPTRCMSILRAPIWHPPGMATCALPNRPMSGPSTEMLARIFETSS